MRRRVSLHLNDCEKNFKLSLKNYHYDKLFVKPQIVSNIIISSNY